MGTLQGLPSLHPPPHRDGVVDPDTLADCENAVIHPDAPTHAGACADVHPASARSPAPSQTPRWVPWFVAVNRNSNQFNVVPQLDPSVDCDAEDTGDSGIEPCWLPANDPAYGLDTSPRNDDAWTRTHPFALDRNVMFTEQDADGLEHGAMGGDPFMLDAFSGGGDADPGVDTSTLYLFEGYLEGLCSF